MDDNYLGEYENILSHEDVNSERDHLQALVDHAFDRFLRERDRLLGAILSLEASRDYWRSECERLEREHKAGDDLVIHP